MAIDWSEKYNKLPIETRRICAAIDNEHRIQHLEAEKARLRARYRQSVAEINDWIANLRRSNADREKAMLDEGNDI